MYTFVAHARPGTRLFDDWEEAAALWSRLVERVPTLRGLVLMPNHLHLDALRSDTEGFDRATRAYAQWRNARRGQRGPVWAARPAPDRLSGQQHVRRNLRYLHLNPCRARLVGCPTSWPFSTHREALGLCADPARERSSDPVAFHRYVSADPSCEVEGTSFPASRLATDRLALSAIAGAVSEYLRVPLSTVYRPGRARRTFLAAARTLTSWPGTELARHVGCSRSLVSKTAPMGARPAAVIARMAADDRFPGLTDRDPRLGGRRAPRFFNSAAASPPDFQHLGRIQPSAGVPPT